MSRYFEHVDPALLVVAIAGLAGGLIAMWLGASSMAPTLWWIGTVPVLAWLVIEIIRSLLRGDFGLDLIAALSMVSALAIGEPLAANVVALMYAGGFDAGVQLIRAFYRQSDRETFERDTIDRVRRSPMWVVP